MTVTDRFATYAVGMRPADLPDAVRHEGLRAFLNNLGCTLGGARHATVDVVAGSLQPFFGAPTATLIGRGRRADPVHACLINTLASCVQTFDDAHAEAVVHPTGPVAAAAMAVAELRPTHGRDFLAAVVLGIEAVCRLSKAVSVAPAEGEIAWSQTGITGGVGAAVAAGRLLGLDAAELKSAIAIAVIQASGIRVAQGSMASALMPAHAARAGIHAAFLAKGGLAADIDSLGGGSGFLEMYSKGAYAAWLEQDLGVRHEILSNTYKPYPSGIVVNPVIEACLKLRAEHGIARDAVARVELVLNPKALTLTNRPQPRDGTAAQVSYQHWAAVSLMFGHAGIGQLADGVVHDPAVAAMRARIEGIATPDMDPDSVDVRVVLTNGTVLHESLRHCAGSRERPVSDQGLETKFRGLAEARLADTDIADLIARCWALEETADVADIARRAAGASS